MNMIKYRFQDIVWLQLILQQNKLIFSIIAIIQMIFYSINFNYLIIELK